MGCKVHFYKSVPDKAHARKKKKPKQNMRTMKAKELTKSHVEEHLC